MSWVGAENDHRFALSAGEVHLWSAPLDVSAETLATLSRALDGGERDRARQFRFEHDRVRWIAARGWLRRLLAAYLGADPAKLRFERHPFGKPRLAAPSQWLCFNASHSAEMAAFAIAPSTEVGIDLERVSEDASSNPVPLRFLSQRERAALGRLSGYQRPRASLQCWTGKEAYLKAVGLGLREPLAALDVAFLLEQTTGANPQSQAGIGAGWSLHAFDPGPGYVGAVAVHGSGACVPGAARRLHPDAEVIERREPAERARGFGGG